MSLTSPPPTPPASGRGDYRLSTDPAAQQLDVIHGFLAQSYWAAGIPRDVVARALAHSLVVGAFAPDGAQVGFARVVSDRATFAYLDDVFVLDGHRRQGLATRMVAALRALPELQRLKTWLLFTRDRHALYAGLGFQPFPPGIAMAVVDREAWSR